MKKLFVLLAVCAAGASFAQGGILRGSADLWTTKNRPAAVNMWMFGNGNTQYGHFDYEEYQPAGGRNTVGGGTEAGPVEVLINVRTERIIEFVCASDGIQFKAIAVFSAYGYYNNKPAIIMGIIGDGLGRTIDYGELYVFNPVSGGLYFARGFIATDGGWTIICR